MNRFLLPAAAIAAPTLICMAIVIYIFSPPSAVPDTQLQPGEMRAVAMAAPARRADSGVFSWLMRSIESGETSRSAVAETPEAGEEVSQVEQATQWEELAFSETSDLQTRSEALVNLTRVDAARGEYALGAMATSGDVGDKMLAVSLLSDWRNRTGDPDGRIAGLLQQAANDPDAGVAYQARVALDPEQDREQTETVAPSSDYEGEPPVASAD